jgi:hypothetical protein
MNVNMDIKAVTGIYLDQLIVCLMISPPTLLPFDTHPGLSKLGRAWERFDLVPSARADPAPSPDQAEFAEEVWLRRQGVEPRHVEGRVDALEIGCGSEIVGHGESSPTFPTSSNAFHESVMVLRFILVMAAVGRNGWRRRKPSYPRAETRWRVRNVAADYPP